MSVDEYDFRRETCPFDKNVASFKIADSRICLLCYGAVRKTHLNRDEIEVLTLAQLSAALAGELVVPEADKADTPGVVEPVPGHE